MKTETTSIHTSFIESDAGATAAELRARMDEQGYLLFRGLIPAGAVLETRRAVLEHCREAGWLDPSRDLMEAAMKPGSEPLQEGRAEYMPVYRKILKTPSFHDFPQQPALMQVAAKLLEGEVLVHPRRIGRIAWPNLVGATTPPHQDHFYIRGAITTYSCWTPLGECPLELGGLAVWPGSQKRGFLDHSVKHPGATGGSGVPVDENEAQWHASDFGLGDALFFHSLTIHKALPNLTNETLRLSTDNRYQARQDEIDPASLQPHF